MTSFKKQIYTLLLSVTSLTVYAQTNGSNSPYSRFGLGNLNEQSQGFNKAMNGLAIGVRDGGIVNMQNPASYSAIDSLAFLFDVGLTLQNANFKSGNSSINAHNTSLDYVNAGLRLTPGLGISFGFVPFSTIGYNYSETKYLGNDSYTGTELTYVNSFSGSGGLHKTYVGLGWNPFADLSIGFNAGFIWGNYSQNLVQTFYEGGTSSSTTNGLNRHIEADLSSYTLDFGLQYPITINKDNKLTIGATYGLGHTIKSPVKFSSYVTDGDTTSISYDNAFDIPMSVGGGLSWIYKQKLLIGADVTYQKWSDCNAPQIVDNNFVITNSGYMDRTRAVIGAEYTPDYLSRNYFSRIKYKIGFAYTTPYYKVDSHNGPRELSITAGFGLPVSNKINNRSVINLSFQWVNMSAGTASLIKENYLRLNVGITFNEKWFMKWKIQ